MSLNSARRFSYLYKYLNPHANHLFHDRLANRSGRKQESFQGTLRFQVLGYLTCEINCWGLLGQLILLPPKSILHRGDTQCDSMYCDSQVAARNEGCSPNSCFINKLPFVDSTGRQAKNSTFACTCEIGSISTTNRRLGGNLFIVTD